MVEAMALRTLAGFDPRALLRVGDDVELIAVDAITTRALELQQLRDENLATLIANRLGQVLGG